MSITAAARARAAAVRGWRSRYAPPASRPPGRPPSSPARTLPDERAAGHHGDRPGPGPLRGRLRGLPRPHAAPAHRGPPPRAAGDLAPAGADRARARAVRPPARHLSRRLRERSRTPLPGPAPGPATPGGDRV